MKADNLRKKFLEFFAGKKHKIIESDSLVPAGDPTVLFTSAGMNQFKKQFLGQITDFRRAASSQKCLRTDDLEKVGVTPFHHTFFEMLGNFSFGDYFKKEAIEWAWEFLTEWLKIPKDKLWVSVYKEDDEAYEVWSKEIKVSKDRIIKLGDKENFWPSEAKQKGPNGPCGPCSEIFYDYGKDVGCGKKDCDPSCSCGRFAEVWNLVFTQFNRKEGGALEPLPNKNIDTGMGLERLAAVMQGVKSNFETDLFQPIVKEIIKEAGRSPNIKTVYVISDHIRAIAFAILDGVLPSNDSRGYVVRKLIRRGVNNCRQIGLKKPFLYKLVPVVAEVMQEPYPGLLQRRENIAAIIKKEEESFWKVLKEIEPRSVSSLDEFKKEYKSQSELAKKVAQFAFELHDTYGYPKEMTEAFAKSKNVPFDEKHFDSLMQEQKLRSKSASSMVGDVFVDSEIKVDLKPTEFVGFDTVEEESKILKIFDSENKEINSTKGLKSAKVILDKTPFYAESGGQVYDKGLISKDTDAKLEVIEVRKIHESIVHICGSIKGEFKVQDKVSAKVDVERRLAIARNHTATHLLQAALRKVLGEHVQQQGSLVAEDRLRFDFTHFKQLTKEELSRVEELVNEYILNNETLKVEEKTTAQAKKEGALAFFAEKYADKSRVVKIGGYSKELCGGTHLKSTGQIGIFKILSEGSVAQGIRRIEATTGKFAYKNIKQQQELIQELSNMLKTDEMNLIANLTKMIESYKEMDRRLSSTKLESLKKSLNDIIASGKVVNAVKIIAFKIEDADFSVLRSVMDMLKKDLKSAIITLGSVKDGAVMIVMGITENLKTKGVDASLMIKSVAEVVGGKGGGRPDLAQAGGNMANKLNDALSKAVEVSEEKVRQ